MVPGQGFIVVGNKTQKIQFVYSKNNIIVRKIKKTGKRQKRYKAKSDNE